MNVFNWLTGHFSNRGKALSLYKRGMAKAKKHDHQGAIDDYTATIGMPHAPASMNCSPNGSPTLEGFTTTSEEQ